MRTAVVGHVEWVTFARVERLPAPGDIIHALDRFEEPAGGAPVAAVQLRKLAGDCVFFTALGDDENGYRARIALEAMGVRVEAEHRPEPQRCAFVHIDAAGERTITVLGSRLGPRADDPLPWHELERCDAAYFTAGDDDALRLARRARVLVATSREAERLVRIGIELDAVVGSATDPSERYRDVDPQPSLVVATQGSAGGTYRTRDRSGTYPASAPSGALVDAYGAGDTFAGALTFALGAGLDADLALELAARCGAASTTGRGAYVGQLSASDL